MNRKLKEIESIFDDEGYVVISDDHTNAKDSNPPASEKELLNNLTTMIEKKSKKRVLEDFTKVEAKTSNEKINDEKVESIINTKVMPDYDIHTIIKRLNWHMNYISDIVIDREEIIRQAVFAILTGEHMLLLSRTGMAKSYLVNLIFNAFDGARVFSSQASKDQTPDNYFGPYNIEEFKKGKIKHNIKGSIIEANLVFLDEFFDASDVVLRSLLSVLNERKFINGAEQIDVAVHTSVATANYMRMNEVTEAVMDRFTYKSIIPEDLNLYNQLLIDYTYSAKRGKVSAPPEKLYFNQILFISDIIRNKNNDIKITIPDIVYFMKNVILNRYANEIKKIDNSYFISPRKQAKISDFLRASAIVNERYEVNMDDLKDAYLSICTLNKYVSVKTKDKSEKDIFLDIFQQVMIHYKTTGAIKQIEFLLEIRRLFEEIKKNPEKQNQILKEKGILEGFLSFFQTFFPNKKDNEEEDLTVQDLKKKVLDLDPAIEEVRILKDGILKDYQGIH